MGWFIGYAVGIGVVAVVVVLLVILILLAKRIAGKAEAVVSALEEARDNTAPLWSVEDANLAVERINDAAAQARLALEAKKGTRA